MNTDASRYDFLAAPATLARGSVTQEVISALRDAIVRLALKPGEVLDKPAICARLGVSRFPVSEALARLQAEGLVDILPQRGTVVSLVRIADVIEYMLIRKALEAEAVRIVTGGCPSSLLDSLMASLELQRAAAQADDRSLFHEHDLAFHDSLSAGMGFGRLKGIIDGTRANLDRARRLIITPRRLADTLSEHQTILAAIAAGDTEASTAAMRAHIDSVMGELLAFARMHPLLFADGGDEAHANAFPFG